jgi:membrane-associated protease RseP (regulator of RpoE activity)
MSNGELTDMSKFKNIFNKRREVVLSIFGFFIIVFSLCLFFFSLTKAYIGVSLHMSDDVWVVQSLDSSGLGALAGIQIGDTPVTINGQPANEFLRVYEHQKQVMGVLFTELTVIDNSGQTISVSTENSAPPKQYILEVIPYIIV